MSAATSSLARMDLLIAVLVFAGTALQMSTSVRDFNSSRERELEWWRTEDELIAEIPWWRWIQRVMVRRDLRAQREPAIHEEIQHMARVFASWMMLWVGSVLLVLQTAFG